MFRFESKSKFLRFKFKFQIEELYEMRLLRFKSKIQNLNLFFLI